MKDLFFYRAFFLDERSDPGLEEMPRRNHIGVGWLAALVSYERSPESGACLCLTKRGKRNSPGSLSCPGSGPM